MNAVFRSHDGARRKCESARGLPQSKSFAPLKLRNCCGRFLILVLLLFCGASSPSEAGETNRARLSVSGYGFFGSRQLKKLLTNLQPEGAKPEFYDANFIEDSALLLISTLRRDGYLKPRIIARITFEDQKTVDYEWRETGREPLPRPLRARRVRFKITEGKLYHYESVQIDGLRIMPVKEARAFFIEKDVLIHLKDTRIYTPEKLKQSLNNLQEAMERRGYESAKVEVAELQQNDHTGKVRVRIKANEGRKSLVRSIRKEIYLESTNTLHEASLIKTNAVFSQPWAQDFKQDLRTIYYHQGYPDASVDLVKTNREESEYVIEFDLLAKVLTGPRVKLDKVKFEGYRKTSPTFLAKRVGLKEGTDLDRVKVEEGRYRLARLGIFDSVDLRYDLVNERERDAVYAVKEGKRMDLSVLAGYGSYELLRGGLEFEQFNVWGLAHHSRLRLIQSFKASSGDYTYNVPSIFGGDVDLFLNATGLRRDEVSFVREEYGGGVGLRRAFKSISSDLSVRYQYQVLHASDVEPGLATEGLSSATVGTIITELRHDRRDNPLYPRKGYKVFSNLEIGSSYIGGDANYQRFEAAGAYHVPLYDSGWLNLGLSHGVLLTIGSKAVDLPFNRRFFPGGENSIRGYQEGEASPRNAAGQFTGAETYVLGNIEFEQALTKAFSLVVFSDSIGFARELSDYPLNESLFAAGVGLRWKTIVGPIRLEYGHNLNPREGDPSGTIHFSMGFPF